MEKKDLQPAVVFHYFEEVCQVPRPSKKEEKSEHICLSLPKTWSCCQDRRSWQCLD